MKLPSYFGASLHRRIPRLVPGVATAGALGASLALSACGTSSTATPTLVTQAQASAELTESAEPVSPHFFPDVDVVDVSSGQTLNIASELAGGDRPLLLWFWAPH